MSKQKRNLTSLLGLSLLVAAFGPHHAAAQSATKTYEVSITNITQSKQALSPVVLTTHPASLHAWQLGGTATRGLELLAEDGRPDDYANELRGLSAVTDVEATHAHLLPGDTISVRITANEGDVLSAATMLIQTNDGFTGLDGVPLATGDIEPKVYDAGTEDNSELKADIPGFFGPFHGPDTKPQQPITLHPGITGKAEVPSDFNWSGAVARFTIREVSPITPAAGTYELTITNSTTSKQSLSPVVIATHSSTIHAWQPGTMSSKGLELLAEDGKPDMFADEIRLMNGVTDVATTHAHLLPGDFITVMIKANPGDVLSTATMLINTNDGFTGLDNAAITAGSTEPMVYDAGTEDNSEIKADIPGFYGPLHGPDTTPHQAIALHSGITGKAEVPLDFNWPAPVARFTLGAAGTTTPTAPGMPVTGSTDNLFWPIAVLATGLSLLGLSLRRSAAKPQR